MSRGTIAPPNGSLFSTVVLGLPVGEKCPEVCCLSCGLLCMWLWGQAGFPSTVRRNSSQKIPCCKEPRGEIQRGIIQTSPFEEQRFRCLQRVSGKLPLWPSGNSRTLWGIPPHSC